MAKRGDLPGEVVRITDETPASKKRRELHQARRTEALALILAGLSYEQVAERLDISMRGVYDMVNRTLHNAENRVVEEMRNVENARLDRVQAAIWPKALKGDIKAVDAYLKISARRAKMNGLDAPTKVNLSLNVRTEMEQALNELEQVVLGEVLPDVDESDSPE